MQHRYETIYWGLYEDGKIQLIQLFAYKEQPDFYTVRESVPIIRGEESISRIYVEDLDVIRENDGSVFSKQLLFVLESLEARIRIHAEDVKRELRCHMTYLSRVRQQHNL